MARMNVVFKDSLLEEMRELVPVRQRSEFIEEAVRARLAQLRQLRAVQDAAGAWSNEGREEPSRSIRETREAWESLWLDEARRRDQEMDEGRVAGIPGDEVFARIRSRLA
jgi:hypothetical protein